MALLTSTRLTDDDRAAVLDLIGAATRSDGVAPVSEQGSLTIRGPEREGVRHLLLSAEATAVPDAAARPALVGYAQLEAEPGAEAAAELVVAPAHRLRGHGGALLDALLAAQPAVRVWSHGLLPGAAELARSRGLDTVRELLKMARPLAQDDEFPVALPEGYTLTTYDAADPRDARDWLAVNAAAFATHPEQGRMTLDDLRAREREPWFDAAGFFLVRDADGRLAASHWTKVADGVGEVYVVGVSPDHQGLGLGRAVTAIGLAHLRDLGLPEVELYVDGGNAAARATYEAQGFRTVTRDVQFATPVSR